MNILLETLLWLLIIQVFVTIHFWIIERRNKSPRHLISWICSVALAILISIYSATGFTKQGVNALYLGFLYWILFPLQLNLFRKVDLLYIGMDEDPEEDSMIDKFERLFGDAKFTLELKILIFIVCLISLILI